MKKIHIALADDEHLFLKGLEGILSEAPGFEVIFTAAGGATLIEYVTGAQVLPDIVLLDLRMEPVNGIDTTRTLKEKYPELKVIILSTYYREAFLGYMIKLGVSAFLPKNMAPEELIQVIRKVDEKGLFLSEEHVAAVREQIMSGKRFESPVLKNAVALTNRETEVLQDICDQLTSSEIAEKRFVSIRTVEGHRNNLLMKTGAKNTVGLVMFALLNNIVDVNTKLMEYSLNKPNTL